MTTHSARQDRVRAVARIRPARVMPRQVGEIRVLARCEDRVLTDRHLEQWWCRCACGALQKRTRANIVRASRHRQNMSCYVCRAACCRTCDYPRERVATSQVWRQPCWCRTSYAQAGSGWRRRSAPRSAHAARMASRMGDSMSGYQRWMLACLRILDTRIRMPMDAFHLFSPSVFGGCSRAAYALGASPEQFVRHVVVAHLHLSEGLEQ